MIDPTKLRKYFTEQAWRKGVFLQQRGHVVAESINHNEDGIFGLVKSQSHDDIYDVVIFEENNRLDSDCTCYVGYLCKHAAALAAACLQKDIGYEADTDQVEQWLNSLLPSTESQKNELDIGYILSQRNYLRHAAVFIEVVKTKRLKSGKLSQSFQTMQLNRELLENQWVGKDDRYLLADIFAITNYSKIIDQFDLIERLVLSGKCYWQTISERPMRLGKAISAQFRWKTDSSDLQKLQLEINDHCPGVQIIETQPLSYFDPDSQTIGLINTTTTPTKQRDLYRMPALSKQQLGWVIPQLESIIPSDVEQFGLPHLMSLPAAITPVPILHLESFSGNPENTSAFVHFRYRDRTVKPLDESFSLTLSDGSQAARNKVLEQEYLTQLENAGLEPFRYPYQRNSRSNTPYVADAEFRCNKNYWPEFVHLQIPELRQQGWEIVTKDDFYYDVADVGEINANLQESENGYLSLSMQLEVDGKWMPLAPILQSAIAKLPKSCLINPTEQTENLVGADEILYVQQFDGYFIPIKLSKVLQLVSQFVELSTSKTTHKDGSVSLSKYQSHQLFSHLESSQIAYHGDKSLKEFSQKIASFDGVQHVELPAILNAKLRDYQHRGLNWLQFLREYSLSGILADDMGLGKTIQTIAHLCVEKSAGRLTTALIVAPTSVVFNWQAECQKFAPSLRTTVIHGSQRSEELEKLQEFDLVITSYPLIRRDLSNYKKIIFDCIVLDEAQYIKNPKTTLYKALLQLRSTHRLCLTGTPMENHLGELWSQFNWLLPGFLGNQTQFNQLFRNPIEKDQDSYRRQVLRERIKPFILRRDKSLIAHELGEKTTIVKRIRLDAKQAQLYESVRLLLDEKLTSLVQSKGIKRSQIEIIDAMLKLRQICCHPRLLNSSLSHSVTESAKLDVLLDMLDELFKEGRKVILFSQFTSMLALIEPHLQQMQIPYVKLTGNTKDRQQVVQSFKSPDIKLFLISLKAGGTGLNLTEADTVIHYDPWWNPAVENQATDRAHRIGQTKSVFVYKLVVEGSIEEKIVELQDKKSALTDTLLKEGLAENSDNLTAELLEKLLQPLEY